VAKKEKKKETIAKAEKIKKETQQPEQKPTVVKKEQKEEQKEEQKVQKIRIEEKKYELQLAARKDFSRIEIEKNKLEQNGYDVKITTTKKNGKIFYRLRLAGLFTPSEAKKLGEKLKKRFPSIDEYWVQKVK